MSDRNVAAQDEQPLLDQIPASPPHRQAQPRLPAQRPRAQPSAARLWIISALVLVGVVLSFLTQIGYMGAGSSKGGHHNDVFKHGQSKVGSEGQSLNQDQAVMSGKRSVGYFVNWGIYGRKYFPQQIPSQHLTHINYAFANINKDTGEVALSDAWADVEIHYDGDSWNDEGANLYGNFKAIYLLKKQNRNLKVLLSIGGWTYSPNFANVPNPNWRAAFVHSSVKLVEELGLDGLDIDYEYPKTPSDAQAYVDLLRELRGGLNHLAGSKGRDQRQYQLTVAAPCGSSNMEILHVHAMDQYLDFWNLMAYDFAGSWDPVAGHQANLYSAVQGGTSVDNAVRFYQSRGVHPSKLVVGMPLYGRAFANTNGIGAPYNGTGEGSWEAGMWDYKVLPQSGAEEINDHRLGASYSYDRNKRLLISYDTQAIVTQKAQYINQNALGGVMWWELDSDKPEETGGNLVRTVREQFGQLEYRQNELEYPGSKYDNLRKGMP